MTVGGAARALANTTPVTVSGSTVTLTLASPVIAGQAVTVAYTAPSSNPIQDAAGNAAATFAARTVTNATPGIVYAGSFTEAAANDGSVTGSVTATLTGDTFAAASTGTTAAGVTASNVPTGLTAVLTRTNDRTVTLTLTGKATAHANADDVSNLTITFADAAFTNETAATVSGSSKNDIAIDFTDASGIVYAGSFTEAAANDGSVTGSVTATLAGDTFAPGTGAGGTTAAGVTASNVPTGLTAVLTRTNDRTVTLTLTGKATAHANADDVSNLTITFADAAFTNETAATVSGSSKTDIAIDFTDASSIVYAGSFTEASVNDGSVTGSVTATLAGDTFAPGTGAGGTTAAGVTASNVPAGLTAVLTRTNDRTVTLTLTGKATAHANADDVSNLTITFADAAFANETAATVSGSSKTDIAIDFTDASGIVYAGSFTEASANDGSVTGSVTATLAGDTFAPGTGAGGRTAAGVTASNVPTGLTAVLTRTNDRTVTLTLTGKATAHANADDVSNLTITFADAAFANETAATVSGSSKNDIAIDFTDASGIVYAGSFTEAATNDGSVTGSVTATLSGDTFAAGTGTGGTTAAGVTASNVPNGLTAVLTRTSDTVVTLTLTGTANSHADANDVSNLTITFADAAFTNETAATVSGSSKNDIAIDFTDASGIVYAGSFTEAATNDGSVTGSVTATLAGDTFAPGTGAGGRTAAGVTASNVPDGLTAVLTRTNDRTVTLTLTGTATNHANADDVSNLTITFADAAFTNETAATVSGSSKTDIAIDFADASGIAYAGSFTEAAANDGSVIGQRDGDAHRRHLRRGHGHRRHGRRPG